MEDNIQQLLRDSGLRATPGRMEIIAILKKEKGPITVKELAGRLPHPLNEVTLYRALEALVEADLVAAVELGHGHMHYELKTAKAHHHHLVCVTCGMVEDFVQKECESLLADTAEKSQFFQTVTGHSMEVFGQCRTCI